MPINPMTLAQTLPANEYKMGGGLGGYMSGMQLADYLDNMDRARNWDNLQMNSETNKYNNEIADNPVKEAERAVKINNANLTNELFKSGDMQEVARAKIREQLDKINTDQSSNAIARLNNQSSFMFNLGKELSEGVISPIDATAYQARVEEGRKLGINLPPTLNPETMQKIIKMGKIASITQEEIRQVRSTEKSQTFQKEMQADRLASQERQAASRNANRGLSTDPWRQIIQRTIAKEDLSEKDIRGFVGALIYQVKSTPYLAELDRSRKEASSSWKMAGNKKTPEMAKYKTSEDYAESVFRNNLEQYLLGQTMSLLDGKSIVDDNTNPVGSIGPDSVQGIVGIIKQVVSNEGGLPNEQRTNQGVSQSPVEKGSAPTSPSSGKANSSLVGPNPEDSIAGVMNSPYVTQMIEKHSNTLGNVPPDKIIEMIKEASKKNKQAREFMDSFPSTFGINPPNILNKVKENTQNLYRK